MPTTNRQRPPIAAEPSAPAGSVLATAVPVASLREERVRVCIYGRNRSGKTTLACQFRKPLLIVSTEPDACGGATSVADVPGVSIIRAGVQKQPGDRVHGSAKVAALAAELRGSCPFATVVLDTATSLQELILVEIMRWDSVPGMMQVGAVGKENYQYRAELWRKAMIGLFDLSNCDLVVLAQEKDHNPATDDFGGKRKILGTMQQGSFMAPALGATNAQWLQDNCGYVVQIYEDEVTQEVTVPMNNPDGTPAPPSVQRVGTGRRQRHLRLLYHPNFAAGGRWQYNRDMPEFVTAPTPAELYAAMAAYIPALR